jgi:hypothetical protein
VVCPLLCPIRKLKEIHTATHPAKLARSAPASDADTQDQRDALLTALAAEVDEDEAADGGEAA